MSEDSNYIQNLADRLIRAGDPEVELSQEELDRIDREGQANIQRMAEDHRRLVAGRSNPPEQEPPYRSEELFLPPQEHPQSSNRPSPVSDEFGSASSLPDEAELETASEERKALLSKQFSYPESDSPSPTKLGLLADREEDDEGEIESESSQAEEGQQEEGDPEAPTAYYGAGNVVEPNVEETGWERGRYGEEGGYYRTDGEPLRDMVLTVAQQAADFRENIRHPTQARGEGPQAHPLTPEMRGTWDKAFGTYGLAPPTKSRSQYHIPDSIYKHLTTEGGVMSEDEFKVHLTQWREDNWEGLINPPSWLQPTVFVLCLGQEFGNAGGRARYKEAEQNLRFARMVAHTVSHQAVLSDEFVQQGAALEAPSSVTRIAELTDTVTAASSYSIQAAGLMVDQALVLGRKVDEVKHDMSLTVHSAHQNFSSKLDLLLTLFKNISDKEDKDAGSLRRGYQYAESRLTSASEIHKSLDTRTSTPTTTPRSKVTSVVSEPLPPPVGTPRVYADREHLGVPSWSRNRPEPKNKNKNTGARPKQK